ncbi:MAG: flagellar hook protein FlgE [Campylobacterales bacterium]
MLKSLWSGVSGMQAHQIALDVEGNNISNVNTTGFKYSRANFADMLSQTKRIATSPQSSRGGQNELAIGLGTQINSTQKIFLQGSIQSTDKNTDMAIQGDGFFMVSADAGSTYRYTRSGDFTFDANGNLVDNNGYVVQGWLKEISSDSDACEGEDLFTKVDSSGPTQNIQIDPGLTLPAKSTGEIQLKANLTSGDTVEQMECIYELDSSASTSADGSNMRYDSNGEPTQLAEDFGVLFNDDGEAFNLTAGQGIWMSYNTAQVTAANPVAAGAHGHETITFELSDGSNYDINYNLSDTTATATDNANTIATAINQRSEHTGIEAVVTGAGSDTLQLINYNDDTIGKSKNIVIDAVSDASSGLSAGDEDITAYRYNYTDAPNADSASGQFKTTEDLRALVQQDANIEKSGTYVESAASVQVTVNDAGRFEIKNQDDGDTSADSLRLAVTAYSDTNVSANTRFTSTFAALNASLSEDSFLTTTAINAASHYTSIEVFDSLGSKHVMEFEFRKTGSSEWSWRSVVPEPGVITGHPDTKNNVYENGTVTFNNDGSLRGFNPPTLQYDPQNGSKAPQLIRLEWGTSGKYDGLTSVDMPSSTENIKQNGFGAGDLLQIRTDATGTLLGSFSNGKTVGLAQVAMAKFANNAGLQSEGNNHFSQSANSGDPIVGEAATSGRGEIAAASLEMSNVDLSRSLTQLIVVQRGFQANSKTVTTSDQVLNTLLGLKQ